MSQGAGAGSASAFEFPESRAVSDFDSFSARPPEPAMLRDFVRFLPLCFLVTACGTSARHQALVERRDAIRASNAAAEQEFLENYRSRDGFQDTRWGMSPEEVKALYPGAHMTNTEGDLRVETRVVDRLATVHFFFTQDKLAVVRVQFANADPLRTEFSSLSELLVMKYGQPTKHVDTAAEAEDRLWELESSNDRVERNAKLRELGSGRRTKGDPVDAESRQWEEEAREEALHARNNYDLQQLWKDSETLLLLAGQQTSSRSTLTLQYQSRQLSASMAHELEAYQGQRKRELSEEL